MLGVGGVRALAALGISPGVVHLNEGHSAFAALELIRRRMRREGIDVGEAAAARGRARRLHHAHAGAGRPRPLRAGADRGASRTAARRARACRTTTSWRSAASIPHDHDEPFCMTVLALKVVPARQRGVVAARPRLARDVDAALSRPARGPGADRPHHQRRARQHLAGAADAAGLRAPPRRRLDGAQHASRSSGTRSRTSTTASCGRRIRR